VYYCKEAADNRGSDRLQKIADTVALWLEDADAGRRVMKCVAGCCRVLQGVVVCCSMLRKIANNLLLWLEDADACKISQKSVLQ